LLDSLLQRDIDVLDERDKVCVTMDAIRRGLRIGNLDSEGNLTPTTRPNQLYRNLQNPVFTQQPTSERAPLEPETTVKNKIISVWNNVKYGKNAWSTTDIFKQGFSRNSPVWLLGQAYHRKLVSTFQESPPKANTVGTFTETDCGIEAFEKDFKSRVWLTYRKEFEEFEGTRLNTDCGWGCMIRSGQMLIAQAIVLHWLGRDWRADEAQSGILSVEHWKSEKLHRAIIQLFSDTSDTKSSPLSIHHLVSLGQAAGKKAGDWFGPHSVAHLLAGAVRQAARGDGRGLLDGVVVTVAQDCTIYKQDIEDLCNPEIVVESNNKDSDVAEDFSVLEIAPNSINRSVNFEQEETSQYSLTQDVVIDGETWCLEQESKFFPQGVENAEQSVDNWKSLIILIPVRLGSDSFNPIYSSCVKNLLTLESCIGIIGGKPKHSLYFIGFQDEDLIHLDPHRLQDKVETFRHNFSTDTFHCKNPRKIQLKKMDPSCCIGFYLRTRAEYEAWCESIMSVVTPPQINGIRNEYPMFVVAEGRGAETKGLSDWVRLGHDSVNTTEAENQDIESEEFVFL